MFANKLASAVVFIGLAAIASAQSAATVHHRKIGESGVTVNVATAENAIDKKDYRQAESLLKPVVAKNPADARAWFDLGLVYSATERKPDAAEAYEKSASAKPQFFEANLNAGLLLATLGHTDDAVKYLKAASQLEPSDPAHASSGKFLAWYSLGKLQAPTSPSEALQDFQKASAYDAKNFQVHLAEAELMAQAKDLSGAQREYQKALAIQPQSEEALRGLVNLFIAAHQPEQAKNALQQYLSVNPNNAQAHLQLARILSSSGDYAGASAELEAAQKLQPGNTVIARELAGNAALQGKYALAESQYRQLLASEPRDADLHFALGTALMNQRKFREAEPELLQATQLNPQLVEAYGNLATVAAENQQYALAIKALDTRAQLSPEVPGSYFLRASCLDHLRRYKEAAQNYRMFLSVANGKFPDQEWQAQHRLLAIAPK